MLPFTYCICICMWENVCPDTDMEGKGQLGGIYSFLLPSGFQFQI